MFVWYDVRLLRRWFFSVYYEPSPKAASEKVLCLNMVFF